MHRRRRREPRSPDDAGRHGAGGNLRGAARFRWQQQRRLSPAVPHPPGKYSVGVRAGRPGGAECNHRCAAGRPGRRRSRHGCRQGPSTIQLARRCVALHRGCRRRCTRGRLARATRRRGAQCAAGIARQRRAQRRRPVFERGASRQRATRIRRTCRAVARDREQRIGVVQRRRSGICRGLRTRVRYQRYARHARLGIARYHCRSGLPVANRCHGRRRGGIKAGSRQLRGTGLARRHGGTRTRSRGSAADLRIHNPQPAVGRRAAGRPTCRVPRPVRRLDASGHRPSDAAPG